MQVPASQSLTLVHTHWTNTDRYAESIAKMTDRRQVFNKLLERLSKNRANDAACCQWVNEMSKFTISMQVPASRSLTLVHTCWKNTDRYAESIAEMTDRRQVFQKLLERLSKNTANGAACCQWLTGQANLRLVCKYQPVKVWHWYIHTEKTKTDMQKASHKKGWQKASFQEIVRKIIKKHG